MTNPRCYSGREHIYDTNQEPKKKKTALSKGKRYHCTICRKRSPRKVRAPYYCPEHKPKDKKGKKRDPNP